MIETYQKREHGGVSWYASPLLSSLSDEVPIRHGFSTRRGGVSREEHLAEMNLGFFRGEERSLTEHNYELFAKALGICPESLVFANQTHTHTVAEVGSAHRGVGVTKPPVYFPGVPAGDPANEVDALVTAEPNVALGVRIADCVPILFCDPKARVIGAAHAGWRGTLAQIAVLTLYQMEALGARAENVRCAIGPYIGPCCYEVDRTFYERFLFDVGSDICEKAFTDTQSEHPRCDLGTVNEELLTFAGVLPEHISRTDLCTCCHPDLFHSHRATGGKRGTNGAVIALCENAASIFEVS